METMHNYREEDNTQVDNRSWKDLMGGGGFRNYLFGWLEAIFCCQKMVDITRGHPLQSQVYQNLISRDKKKMEALLHEKRVF